MAAAQTILALEIMGLIALAAVWTMRYWASDHFKSWVHQRFLRFRQHLLDGHRHPF